MLLKTWEVYLFANLTVNRRSTLLEPRLKRFVAKILCNFLYAPWSSLHFQLSGK